MQSLKEQKQSTTIHMVFVNEKNSYPLKREQVPLTLENQESSGGCRPVGTPPPIYFGRSINTIPTREQIISTTLLLAPAGFLDLPTALWWCVIVALRFAMTSR